MHGSSASAHHATRLCDPCPHVLLQTLQGEYSPVLSSQALI